MKHLLAIAAIFCLAGPVQAAEPRAEIWDIPLGTPVGEITADFVDLACGSNGGPPSRRLASFADFATCRPEKSGLHEVYFRYDDEQEYIARSLEQRRDVLRFGGTVVFGFPVVASLLIDGDGLVQGRRVITDPRPGNQTSRPRYEFWTLGNLLRNHFGSGWACSNGEPAAGENPVGTYFVKSDCSLESEAGRFSVGQHYLQKRGQSFIDPVTTRFQPDAFDSMTRFEQLAPGFETVVSPG